VPFRAHRFAYGFLPMVIRICVVGLLSCSCVGPCVSSPTRLSEETSRVAAITAGSLESRGDLPYITWTKIPLTSGSSCRRQISCGHWDSVKMSITCLVNSRASLSLGLVFTYIRVPLNGLRLSINSLRCFDVSDLGALSFAISRFNSAVRCSATAARALAIAARSNANAASFWASLSRMSLNVWRSRSASLTLASTYPSAMTPSTIRIHPANAKSFRQSGVSAGQVTKKLRRSRLLRNISLISNHSSGPSRASPTPTIQVAANSKPNHTSLVCWRSALMRSSIALLNPGGSIGPDADSDARRAIQPISIALLMVAHRTASEIAVIVAGTRFPPLKVGNFLAARIAAAMSTTRFRPSSIQSGSSCHCFFACCAIWAITVSRCATAAGSSNKALSSEAGTITAIPLFPGLLASGVSSRSAFCSPSP
jgi:hypothetical protein